MVSIVVVWFGFFEKGCVNSIESFGIWKEIKNWKSRSGELI